MLWPGPAVDVLSTRSPFTSVITRLSPTVPTSVGPGNRRTLSTPTSAIFQTGMTALSGMTTLSDPTRRV